MVDDRMCLVFCKAVLHEGHRGEKPIPSVRMIQYHCSQRAPGSSWFHGKAQVHSPPASIKQGGGGGFTLGAHSHVSEPFSLGRHHLDGLQCNLSAVIASA